MDLMLQFQSGLRRSEGDFTDALARLLVAAKHDGELRGQIIGFARLPPLHRESLVNTALHEMSLRGESPATCAAFAALASDLGVKTALEFLAKNQQERIA